jgi:hypothetical protein
MTRVGQGSGISPAGPSISEGPRRLANPAGLSTSPARSACVGRIAASKIASASTASFFEPLTKGFTNADAAEQTRLRNAVDNDRVVDDEIGRDRG